MLLISAFQSRKPFSKFYMTRRKLENTNQKKIPYLFPLLIKFEPLVGPLNQFGSSWKFILYLFRHESMGKIVAVQIREQSANMAHPISHNNVWRSKNKNRGMGLETRMAFSMDGCNLKWKPLSKFKCQVVAATWNAILVPIFTSETSVITMLHCISLF